MIYKSSQSIQSTVSCFKNCHKNCKNELYRTHSYCECFNFQLNLFITSDYVPVPIADPEAHICEAIDQFVENVVNWIAAILTGDSCLENQIKRVSFYVKNIPKKKIQLEDRPRKWKARWDRKLGCPINPIVTLIPFLPNTYQFTWKGQHQVGFPQINPDETVDISTDCVDKTGAQNKWVDRNGKDCAQYGTDLCQQATPGQLLDAATYNDEDQSYTVGYSCPQCGCTSDYIRHLGAQVLTRNENSTQNLILHESFSQSIKV